MATTVKITKPPSGKVSSLCTPNRADGLKWTATWKIPSSLTNAKSNNRSTGIQICWSWGCGLGKGNPNYYWKGGISQVSSKFGFGTGWALGAKFADRTKFYPYTSLKLWNVHVFVRTYNAKGYGPWAHTYRPIGKPYKPAISAPVQNKETGVVSCTVTQNRDDKGNSPCQYTHYDVWVKDTRVSNSFKKVQTGNSTAASFNLAYDVSDRQHLTYDQFVQIDFYARAYGFNGYSDLVKRTMYVSYPAKAIINGIDKTTRSATSKVTVRINTKSSGTHYVTGCKLQKLVNTTYKTAAEIPGDASWEDTNAIDNATCTALSVSAGELIPAAGNTTWVRVKTWNQIEDIFYRFSEPFRVTDLEIPAPTAQDDKIQFLSFTPAPDGESAIALFGWNADGKDDADYTELTWSENENAWRSTSAPSSFEFDWSDGALKWTDPSTGEVTNFKASASVYIDGLSEGARYYAKARRVKEVEGTTTYSPYSDMLVATPSFTPPDVRLNAPDFVARGDSLTLSWTFSTEAVQTSWELLLGEMNGDSFTETNVIATGQDSVGSCVVSAERLASLTENSGFATFAVRIATGGAYIVSDGVSVSIADAPVLEIPDIGTVTAQGFSFSVVCSQPANLVYAITSQGADGQYPDGMRTQIAGDTITSDAVVPEWVASDDGYSAQVSVPDGLDLVDGARYTVSVSATHPNTLLESETKLAEFGVEWAHQAPAPAEDIVLTPSDITDVDGYRTRSVQMQLVSPQGALDTDVYDVYRLTPDGTYLIASNQAQNAVVTDLYAPFGSRELAYVIAVRTADGDVNWDSYPYELAGKDLRIDFGSQYIELPWNISISDGYKKDFEARAHLGEDSPQGYWNENVTRTASFATDLIRISEGSQATLLRALGRYGGAVFVRTPNGCAYQANVDINGLDESYNSGSLAVAIDGQEVALGDEYRALPPSATQDTDPESDSAGS